LYFKIADYYNYSYYHERLFSVYVSHYNIPTTFLVHPNVHHESITSHSISRNIPVYDFDWEYYIEKNPDVLKTGDTNPRTAATVHFIEHGYKENLVYKPTPKKYVLLYDDETGHYGLDLIHLIQSIKQYSDYDIILFKKSAIEREFIEKNADIFSLPRGGGYWMWKPYIIREILNLIEPGSLLFYIDSSYRFLAPFDEWTQYVDRHDIMVWKNKPNEPFYPMKQWCKMDVMEIYQIPDDMEICWAGAMLLKNTLYVRSLVDEWLKSCTYQNITDSPSVIPNYPEFIEHRHDQSLLSCVLFRFNVPLHFLSSDVLHNNRVPVINDRPKEESVLYQTYYTSDIRINKYTCHGFGDYIRGTIYLHQLLENTNVTLKVNFSNHLLNQVFVCDNKLSIEECENAKYIFMDEPDNPLDYKIVFTNKSLLTENISDNCKKFIIKNCLTPTIQFSNRLETFKNILGLRDIYSVIHVRLEDNAVLDQAKLSNIIDIIYQIYSEDKNKLLLLASDESYLNEINLPFLMKTNLKRGHVGLNTISLEETQDSMLEFMLMTKSKQIYQLSVYSWGSGFSDIVHKIYNVPIKKYSI
jgi:hypothetical protein